MIDLDYPVRLILLHSNSLTKTLFTYTFTVMAMFAVSLADVQAAPSNCEDIRKALANIQVSIKKNELTLADKIKHKSAPQQQLTQLIKSHLASIEVYNKKTEEFNRSCANQPIIAHKVSRQSAKPTAKQPKSIVQIKRPVKKAQPTAIDINDVTPKADIIAMKGYFLQVGAFSQKKIAQAVQQKLTQQGWSCRIITKPHAYALWVGEFSTKSSVESAKQSLKSKGFDSYTIHIQ
ncbi:MAG: SPOR domain-containing protein [Mariprofundaceae bacterium]